MTNLPEGAVVMGERIYKIGLQRLYRLDGKYFLAIKNRSYESCVEIPIDTARRYYWIFKKSGRK